MTWGEVSAIAGLSVLAGVWLPIMAWLFYIGFRYDEWLSDRFFLWEGVSVAICVAGLAGLYVAQFLP